MIRKLERKDKENWIKLYCGYAKFYKVTMNQEILDTLWEWIHKDRKSTRLNSSHPSRSRMPSSA